MPHRPLRKQKKSYRKVPGCEVVKGEEAERFLKDQLLYETMMAKRDRNLEDADGEETVMVSIGSPVRYRKITYLAHIYCIDNFEDDEKNGWLIHLWHPRLVTGKHKAYRSYMNHMSGDLGVDLWKTGI